MYKIKSHLWDSVVFRKESHCWYKRKIHFFVVLALPSKYWAFPNAHFSFLMCSLLLLEVSVCVHSASISTPLMATLKLHHFLSSISPSSFKLQVCIRTKSSVISNWSIEGEKAHLDQSKKYETTKAYEWRKWECRKVHYIFNQHLHIVHPLHGKNFV